MNCFTSLPRPLRIWTKWKESERKGNIKIKEEIREPLTQKSSAGGHYHRSVAEGHS